MKRYDLNYRGENNEDEKKDDKNLDELKSIGTMDIPEFPNDIQYLTIIGEIEGHIMAPPQKKLLNMNI